MTNVLIYGSGKIAEHLFVQFSALEEIVTYINGRNEARINFLRSKFNSTSLIPANIDVVIICVSDHAISLIASQIVNDFPEALFLHTSGATSGRILNGIVQRYGLFYPLQTFSAGRNVNFIEVPILINSNSDQDLALVKLLADKISGKVLCINEKDRMVLHVAAVFVNNFANKLFDEAFKLLDANNLDFELLKPLMKETIHKLDVLTPQEAQTGPALRGDINTINNHIELLGTDTPIAKLYLNLTKMINPNIRI